jgi:hypothetical protein
MPAVFPSIEWLKEFQNKPASDQHPARIAGDWDGNLYLDGLTAQILNGDLNPKQTLPTRKLIVKRNQPAVLDFIRCAREVTTEIL